MSKYLLEIGTEELPYRFIPQAIEQLRNGFEGFLNNNKIGFEKVDVYATPRRLAVIVSGLYPRAHPTSSTSSLRIVTSLMQTCSWIMAIFMLAATWNPPQQLRIYAE